LSWFKVQVEEEEDDDNDHTPDWKVDVEAPSPANVVGEDAAEKRSNNTCNTENCAEESTGLVSDFSLIRWEDLGS
jgi:hypothetical protein